MFDIRGIGFFTEEDVGTGMAMAETLRNEGFHVDCRQQYLFNEGNKLIDKKAYVVEFSSISNNVFIPREVSDDIHRTI